MSKQTIYVVQDERTFSFEYRRWDGERYYVVDVTEDAPPELTLLEARGWFMEYCDARCFSPKFVLEAYYG